MPLSQLCEKEKETFVLSPASTKMMARSQMIDCGPMFHVRERSGSQAFTRSDLGSYIGFSEASAVTFTPQTSIS